MDLLYGEDYPDGCFDFSAEKTLCRATGDPYGRSLCLHDDTFADSLPGPLFHLILYNTARHVRWLACAAEGASFVLAGTEPAGILFRVTALIHGSRAQI